MENSPYQAPHSDDEIADATLVEQPKQSFLAKWAIWPALAAIIATAAMQIYKLKLANIDGVAATSTVCGAILAAVLFPTIIGYIAYFIGRRSQNAGTWTFVIICALFILGPIYQLIQLRSFGSNGPTKLVIAEFDDFEFKVPRNWVKNTSPDLGEFAVAQVVGQEGKTPAGSIIVEYIPKDDLSLKDVIANLEKSEGVILDHKKLDGLEATILKFPGTSLDDLQIVLAAEREAHFVIISGSALAGFNLKSPFDQMIETWKWKKPAK